MTLRDLREKVQALETERAQLLVEIEGLRKAAESRILALQEEISQMQEEAKSLRGVLGDKLKQDDSTVDTSGESDNR